MDCLKAAQEKKSKRETELSEKELADKIRRDQEARKNKRNYEELMTTLSPLAGTLLKSGTRLAVISVKEKAFSDDWSIEVFDAVNDSIVCRFECHYGRIDLKFRHKPRTFVPSIPPGNGAVSEDISEVLEAFTEELSYFI